MKPRYWLGLILAGLLAGGLLACTPSPSPTASPISPISPVTSPFEPSEVEDVVIQYERTGGIAGTADTWIFGRSGEVEFVSKEGRRSVQLPADAVNAAVLKISGGGFFELQDAYLPADRCCDRFTYRLTVFRSGSSGTEWKTVTTMDGVDQPPALSAAMQAVQELIARVEAIP